MANLLVGIIEEKVQRKIPDLWIHSAPSPEYYQCENCGEKVQKHVYEEGARYHVLSWHSLEKKCSEKTCEINHKCSPSK